MEGATLSPGCDAAVDIVVVCDVFAMGAGGSFVVAAGLFAAPTTITATVVVIVAGGKQLC